MIGPDTIIVPMLNGVPWWFAHGEPLRSVDPDGAHRRCLAAGTGRSAASSTPPAAATAPARVVVAHADKLILGDPEGGAERARLPPCALFEEAGIRPEPSNNIRRAIWYKLWGNTTINPLVGADPGHRRPDAGRVQAVPPRRHGRAGRRRRRDRLPDRGERRGPDGGDGAARRVQDLDAAGRRGRPADRARGPARRADRAGAAHRRRPCRTSTRFMR